LPGGPGSLAGNCDDGIDIGAAFGQELVLVHLGGELGHDQISFRILANSVQYAWNSGNSARPSSCERRHCRAAPTNWGLQTGERHRNVVFAAATIGPVNESYGKGEWIGVGRAQLFD
jgi:hypothetical protein